LVRRTADRLCDELENDIIEGRFRPGDRLDEASLGERFGVSRTPIRETLAKLAASGLVELRPRRGAYVRRASVRDLVEMFEVMAELEAMCARLSARRIDTSRAEQLRQAHSACEKAMHSGDVDRYYYCNEVFHQVIYDSCGNRFLREQTKRLRDRLKPYRRLQLHVPSRVAASLNEHKRMMDAILAGDKEGVDREVRKHILIQGERFSDFLARLPEGPEEAAHFDQMEALF